MNHSFASKKVLVAPLDWGLGHVTRCVPLVRELEEQGAEVVIAASGKGKYLLQKEFPNQEIVEIPGYDVRYSRRGALLPFKLAFQLPRLLKIIRKEHFWLTGFIIRNGIQAVISDNRYGLYTNKVPCVFLTHQLRIKTPIAGVENLVQRFNYTFINRFAECWVPDFEGDQNLAGQLSHPKKFPAIPVRYLGSVSRFCANQSVAATRSVLVILSGPEPQRSRLERQILEELPGCKEPVLIVRGLPAAKQAVENIGPHKLISHLPANALQQEIERAEFIISRCGYSTVMDLARLNKKCVLIPTPGQTEQEYLAGHLSRLNFALCISQKKFRLNQALDLAKVFDYKKFEEQESGLKAAVQHLLAGID